ncbi:glycosyltransferase [Vibrio atypicus]|uniref:glycosyltransferase n=1 Tax=Vibrio atypicus TaxID=558271 RepID=UPI001358F09C|nr:glycosyltransferase [Vibrio atypicus]
MKIAYFIEGEIDIDKPSSVLKKVVRQTKIWSDEGNEVWVFSLRSGNYINIENNELYKFGASYSSDSSALIKLLVIYYNSYRLFNYIKKLSITIIYTRLITYTPFVEMMIRKVPTILEINSYDKKEYSGTAYSGYTRIYTSFIGNRIKSLVSAFVFVTNELADILAKEVGFNPNHKVIANGYSFDNRCTIDEIIGERIKLIFVVSPGQPWHGLDRLCEIAKRLPEYDFQIVGESGIDTNNVFYHGYQTGDALTNLLSLANFGVGTLALDRKDMAEACPLKSREYLFHGLPCFGSYVDTDFSTHQGLPIYMQLADAEDACRSAQQIRDFVEFWSTKDHYKSEVRREAAAILDDKVKENMRLKLLSEVCTRN